jgi:hypothetical protein
MRILCIVHATLARTDRVKNPRNGPGFWLSLTLASARPTTKLRMEAITL